MTAKEIIQELKTQNIEVSSFAHSDIPNPIPNIGAWEEIEQEGGEGQGDHWHSVKLFKDHNVYIMTIGYYSSYDGVSFENGFGDEVKPVQKTITVYE